MHRDGLLHAARRLVGQGEAVGDAERVGVIGAQLGLGGSARVRSCMAIASGTRSDRW